MNESLFHINTENKPKKHYLHLSFHSERHCLSVNMELNPEGLQSKDGNQIQLGHVTNTNGSNIDAPVQKNCDHIQWGHVATTISSNIDAPVPKDGNHIHWGDVATTSGSNIVAPVPKDGNHSQWGHAATTTGSNIVTPVPKDGNRIQWEDVATTTTSSNIDTPVSKDGNHIQWGHAATTTGSNIVAPVSKDGNHIQWGHAAATTGSNIVAPVSKDGNHIQWGHAATTTGSNIDAPVSKDGNHIQWGHVANCNIDALVPGPSYLNAFSQQQLVYQQLPAYQRRHQYYGYNPNQVRNVKNIGVFPRINNNCDNRNGLINGGITNQKKAKRHRTAFKTWQLETLKHEFIKNQYIDRTRRNELASTLQLPERVIKIWFQNHRIKGKRERNELQEQENEASSTNMELDGASTIIQDTNGYFFNGGQGFPHELAQNQALIDSQHKLLPLEGIYDNQLLDVNDNGYIAFTQEQPTVLQYQPQPCCSTSVDMAMQYCAALPSPPPPPPYSVGQEGNNKEPEQSESPTTTTNDSSWEGSNKEPEVSESSITETDSCDPTFALKWLQSFNVEER